MIRFDDARNQMNAMFWASWQLNTPSICGYIPEVRWQGKEDRSLPDASKFWVRVSQQTLIEQQTAFSKNVNNNAGRRFTTKGLMFIQLFCPKSETRSFQMGAELAVVAKNSLRGKSTANCVWFRNVRINELPPEELCFRFNVVAEYEYDEVSNETYPVGVNPPAGIENPCCYNVDGGEFTELQCNYIDGGTFN